jgi:hypothetical protein
MLLRIYHPGGHTRGGLALCIEALATMLSGLRARVVDPQHSEVMCLNHMDFWHLQELN